MKIVLTAFNKKMWSKPMDVPDNTSNDFYLSMPMDVVAYKQGSNTLTPVSHVAKRGHWKRTGGSYLLTDLGITPAEGEDLFAYEYILVDIS